MTYLRVPNSSTKIIENHTCCVTFVFGRVNNKKDVDKAMTFFGSEAEKILVKGNPSDTHKRTC